MALSPDGVPVSTSFGGGLSDASSLRIFVTDTTGTPLCDAFGFLQISGEDVNSPRQSFVCEQLRLPEFRRLTDATWALIEREKSLS